MDWFLYSMICSLCLAIRSDANRKYKLDGFRLNFWRSLFAAILFIPFVFITEWPSMEENALFYILSLITAVVSMIMVTVKFNLASMHNGRVANLEGPAKAFTAFFIWLLVDPASLNELLSQPFKAIGVLAMMCLATYSVNGMRNNDASWSAFLMIAPLGVLVGVLDGVVKLALPSGTPFGQIGGYLFIVFAVSAALAFPIIWSRRNIKRKIWLLGEFGKGKPILAPNMVRVGFITGVLTVIGVSAIYQAFVLAPNPGYPLAIVMTTPIWLLIFHKVRGIQDDASPMMGTLMVLSGIGLVLITS